MSQSLPEKSVSTADLVAAVRGWHQRARVRIFEDPYAGLLCGRLLGLAVKYRPCGWFLVRVILRRVMPASMCVLMRARYSEEALEAAVAAGATQYVIIGAGMDSFAFRRPDLLERISVYEIDHPVTQKKKLERIQRAGLQVPENHCFVPADLTKSTPVEALEGSGFDPAQLTFLSLLGVVYYLTPDSLAKTLRSIADGLVSGTRITVDYLLDKESSNPKYLGFREDMLDFVEARGEPMRSEYSLQAMSDFFSAQGFATVENFAIEDLEQSYSDAFGTLPFEIPGLFAFGTFRVTNRDV